MSTPSFLLMRSPSIRKSTGHVILALALVALLLSNFTTNANAGLCIIGPGAELPPDCTEGYLSPNEVHMILDGLPAGTEILLDAQHSGFFDIVRAPGGTLGGETESFSSTLDLTLTGTGQLAGFARSISIPAGVQTEIGPRDPAAPVQMFGNNMFFLDGAIFGDPDFDSLRIRAGDVFGLPSPGQTTLTQLPGGDFNVDSFFDISYQIDFQGAPGSVLDGFSGSTQGTVGMQAGQSAQPAIPEPTSLLLFGIGILGIIGMAYRRRKKAA